MAHPKHDEVRGRFNRCCGYCGVSEEDAGGQFTVDHYLPTSAGGDEGNDNLIYCCFRYNLYKADFAPTHEEIATEYRVQPSRDLTRQR